MKETTIDSSYFRHKVVIITGASSGIGAACARLLAEQGCKLTLAARSVEQMEALAAELATETLVLRADMTDAADIANMVAQTLERFGRIDIMLANAGAYIPGQFAEGDMDAYSMMLKLNIDGVFRCAHAVIPAMQAGGGGDILVTSSILRAYRHRRRAGVQRQQTRGADLRAHSAAASGGRRHSRDVPGAGASRQSDAAALRRRRATARG